MISERTLRKWRQETLQEGTKPIEDSYVDSPVNRQYLRKLHAIMSKRMLFLTQELLDQHLLRRKK